MGLNESKCSYKAAKSIILTSYTFSFHPGSLPFEELEEETRLERSIQGQSSSYDAVDALEEMYHVIHEDLICLPTFLEIHEFPTSQ